MSGIFPVMYSMLSSEALRQFVEEQFDVGRVVECKILHRGLNDTYIVTTQQRRYILRVYRTPWRNLSEVNYELDVLDFLSRHGVSVSSPIQNTVGQFACEVNAPEGIRYAALFTYAAGERPILNPEICYEYGKTAALIHNLTDGFSSLQSRFHIDLDHLLDNPIQTITPTMTRYGGDIAYVEAWARTIRQRVHIPDMDFGFCHGDFHDWNAHFDNGKLTIFDFDCCGPGFRAYDLAVFLWNLNTNYKGNETANWESFLQGYGELRPIPESQLQAIPWFKAARRIWLAGIYLSNEDVWGTGIVNERFFRSFVNQLKEEEKELGVKIEVSR